MWEGWLAGAGFRCGGSWGWRWWHRSRLERWGDDWVTVSGEGVVTHGGHDCGGGHGE